MQTKLSGEPRGEVGGWLWGYTDCNMHTDFAGRSYDNE